MSVSLFLIFYKTQIDTSTWEYVNAVGNNPSPRANHSSAVIKNNLYIFGGWNGYVRLRDLY